MKTVSGGDLTLALLIGVKGVRTFYFIMYSFGTLLVSGCILPINSRLALFFFIVSTMGFIITNSILNGLIGSEKEYKQIMKIKYLSSFSFLLYIFVAAWYVHAWFS